MSKRPIPRQTVTAVCDWWNGPQGGGRDTKQEPPQEFNPGAIFFGVPIDLGRGEWYQAGTPVGITGFYPTTLSYRSAYRNIMRNKIKLSVYGAFSDAQVQQYGGATPGAVLITPMKYHGICQFKSNDGSLYFAHVHYPDDQDDPFDAPAPEDYKWVDEFGEATAKEEEAFADILFTSPQENFYRVALCRQRTRVEVEKASTVVNVTPTSASQTVWTGSLEATVTPNGSVTATLADNSSGDDIPVVTDITAENGMLALEKKFLHLGFAGTTTNVVHSNQTTNISYITSVAVGKADRVSEVK